ncbi:hypothetical protein EBU99_11660 [bacterium]|nr:hypothetical protein [bacterium]
MSILRNQRYDEFEHGALRDGFRGVPLQQFPWVLEKTTLETSQSALKWNVTLFCLNATPSGFGKKLIFSLVANAELAPQAIQENMFSARADTRVKALFSDMPLAVQDSYELKREGLLEELPKLAKELLKDFSRRLGEEWSVARVQNQLRGNLRQRSPGGFGNRVG